MKLNSADISKAAMQIDIDWKKFFLAEELDRLARKCGFSKRNSAQNKLTGSTFFNLIVMNSDLLCSQSLNGLCEKLLIHNDISLKPSSLNERFNAFAVIFLKHVLQHVIKTRFGSLFGGAKIPFKRFLVKDSTCFQVSSELAAIYPGSGGSGSKASIRIQFEYDLLSGNIVDLSVNAFTNQDAKNSVLTLDNIKSNDLVIRDLAYMHNDVFTGLAARHATYLCRLAYNVAVYEQAGSGIEKLSFKEIYKYMKVNGLSKLEKKVLISEEKIPTRLMIYLLPKNIAEERMRKKNAAAKKNGRNIPSEEYRLRHQFNLIITNADIEKITIDTAYEIYRQRWQIELVFKSWKSIVAIDSVKKVKQHRLESYLFAKLIILMMGWRIYWNLNVACYKAFNHTLSQFKFFQMFKMQIDVLSKILASGLSVKCILLKINAILDKLRLNVKKNKKSSTELIMQLLNIKLVLH